MQVFGCGQRNGIKFFLIQFKGENVKRIIDWETAKAYFVDIMEYFGSRLAWPPMHELIDPNDDNEDYSSDDAVDEPRKNITEARPGTSASHAPNDIEWKE